MSLPKIVYNPGTGDITLQFVRGPQGFQCGWKGRVHDNVATSGLRERVIEGLDLVITFTMGAIKVSDDMDDWTTFSFWALNGHTFAFYPDAALSSHYNCVSDDEGLEWTRMGPGVYSASFRWRIVPDDHAPSGPDVVMKRFYGIAA